MFLCVCVYHLLVYRPPPRASPSPVLSSYLFRQSYLKPALRIEYGVTCTSERRDKINSTLDLREQHGLFLCGDVLLNFCTLESRHVCIRG